MKYLKSSGRLIVVLFGFSAILIVAAMIIMQSQSARSNDPAKTDEAAEEVVLKAGDKAPAFSLKDQNGKTVKLKKIRKKGLVLIAFYPMDDSPVCTIEMKSFGEDYEKFTKLNVQIVGISVDSVKSHKAFAEKFGLQFALLSDDKAGVSKAYGAYNELMKRSSRAYFVVDKKGIIRYALVEKSPAAHEETSALLKIVEDIIKEDEARP